MRRLRPELGGAHRGWKQQVIAGLSLVVAHAGSVVLAGAASAVPVSGAEKPPTADNESVQMALRAADALESAGAYDAARRQLEAVAEHVSTGVAESLALRICNTWDLQQSPLRARACYVELSPQLQDVQIRANARYRAAALAAATGDESVAFEEAAALVREQPAALASARALVLAESLRTKLGGQLAAAQYLEETAQVLAATGDGEAAPPGPRRLAAGARVRAGQAYLALGDAPTAVQVLRSAPQLAETTPWADDAHIWLARALRENNDLHAAAAQYWAFIEAHRASLLAPEHRSEFHDDAFYELARVLEDAGKASEAREIYEKLVKENPSSRLCDDAAFRLALLDAAQGRLDAMQEFTRAYPNSRHAPEAHEVLDGSRGASGRGRRQ